MVRNARSPVRIGAAVLAALALVGAPERARAGAAATEASRADLQSRYERCLTDLDAGRHADAALCLGRVYNDLVAIDPNTRADLYYVLADAVTARTAAAADDPTHLCEAKVLVDDYLERERETQLLRFRRKVVALRSNIERALADARSSGVDPCAAPRPITAPHGWIDASAADKAPAPRPEEAPDEDAPPTDPEVEPTTDPTPIRENPTPGPASGTPKPIPSASAARATPRRLGTAASTALMDAGFIITLSGGGLTGVGAALYAVDRECSEGPPACAKATTPAVRHAGLALMSVGAAALFVGLILRWADQRRFRRLRPRVGAAATPISIAF